MRAEVCKGAEGDGRSLCRG